MSSISWNPDQYAASARFVSDLGEPLLELLAPKAGELILDLGCGDGALSEKIASFGGRVYGADASLEQATAARRRGLNVVVADGHRLPFKPRFDAVFSNAALHWMKRPHEVITGVWSSLKNGGRFVGELGGKGNVAAIQSALHAALGNRGIDPQAVDPWFYPSPEEYARLLNDAGFDVRSIELIPRPTRLPGDIVAWLEIFAQPFTNAVAPSERAALLEEVRGALRSRLWDSEGKWIADYVRLRFQASK